MKTTFIATLLAGTMLVPAAMAQDTQNQSNGATENQATSDMQGDADVVVDPDAPAVRVDVPEPDVTVDQAQPNVTVSQPQPEIIVRQPAPRVTVEIPKPNITVRMPEPNVDVNQQAPQVSVNQGEPQVSIGEESDAEVRKPGGSETADVNIQRSNQAEITMQNANQRPNIRYEREDAQVTVNQEQGEPNITYENSDGSQMSEDQQNQMRQGNQQSTNAQSNQNTQSGQNAMDRSAANNPQTQANSSSGQDQEGANVAVNESAAREIALTVDELTEYNIVGENGNVLGDIQNIVNVDDQLYAVVGSGGFLGLGEKTVAIPLSGLIVRGNDFVAPNISESQVEALQEFDVSQYETLPEDQQITVGSE
ncbi:MAG: PRC-barrel domain-containing protein [Fulvimarina manganoxydans]|uniref:PRC-barrel domain-containing protein n=1 Tax=Fulvimarina manganoxydans TaxID=937218 RepID=UPI002355D1AB|nr:PRC-barrel domain-containing protein [Fulvimarina manganoxydans]MCK5934029.1 PRC-barrel domain-containing protein [Fulvimarina manganoxydans]